MIQVKSGVAGSREGQAASFNNERINMPFPQQEPQQFNREVILALGEGQQGCYGLFRRTTPIYVGSGDIRARLLDHHNGDNPCITREKPTHFVSEVTSNYKAREIELIRELDPLCNRRVG